MDNENKDIRKYLQENNRKITLSQMANALDVTVTTIVRKNRNNNYNAEDIIKICRVVGYSPIKALIDFNILNDNDIKNSNVCSNSQSTNISFQSTTTIIIELLNKIKDLEEKLVNTFDIKE
ncbi:MAG: hypothetical protein LBT99_02780 [Bifidobacteriaceae bacterium]|jgi:transcriptional regulator with XRE-family HTH domain|nr:hypothetical protein [Bifidobacteriaceae bacterium]